MAKYKTTVVDLKAGVECLNTGEYNVVPIQVKSSQSWIWKTFAVIVFFYLSVAASVFFAWHLMKQENMEIQILSAEQISTPSEHVKVLHQIAERTKAAIHLHGDLNQTLKSLKWVSGGQQSFEQGGLKLIDNEIHVPADGLYFVYSQVAYGVPCKVGEDGETQKFLSHNILRYSDTMGGQMPLQDSGHSIRQSGENEMTYSTIYLGAVFKLLQGDRLSTSTNYVDYIDDDSSKTFFGVFAL